MQSSPLLAAALALALAATAALSAAHALEQPETATGFAPKPLEHANTHMIAAANPLAAAAGLAMLRKGGSAIDAAIATQMVLNLVEPQSSGIGGGCFILYWDAEKKTLTSIDGRETAPAGATPNLFLDKDGKPLPREAAMESGRSVGVPGALAALKLAHDKFGKLPWADLFQPAIKLARDGFDVSPRLAQLLTEAPPETFDTIARAYFFDTDGRPWPVGYKLTNPALAATFETIAKQGIAPFYQGNIAQDMATVVQNDSRAPGTLATSDLAAYRAHERQPICSDYHHYEVCGIGPPSSGAIAVSQTLTMLQPLDLGLTPLIPAATHLIATAEQLAFADRARYSADGAFVPVPVAGLLDPTYLASRRALIDPAHAIAHAEAGDPPNTRQGEFGRDHTTESHGTSQISIVDDHGDALSMTTTIEQAFGSRIMVDGFLLNNELTDFSFLPKDASGKDVANRVQPGKQPRSAMDPTIVFSEGRKVSYVLGSPGGPAIILFVLKALIGMIDWHLDPAQAAALVNFGSPGDTFLIESGQQYDPLANAMQALGHQVQRGDLTSGLHIIEVTPNGLVGGADPRREGVALGD